MIVFSSFIRAVYDRDIFPAWIAHYKAFGFDRYVAFLHDHIGEEQYTESAASDLRAAGFEVSYVSGEYCNGAIQRNALESLRQSLDGKDHMVVADSDEFHDMPSESYGFLISKYDAIHGNMIDRWTEDGLPAADPRRNPNHQFPDRGDLWEYLRKLGKIRDQARIGTPKKKYMAFRACYDIDMNGCHINGKTVPVSVLDNQDIMHYTWKKGILKRLAGKTYFSVEHFTAICCHFGISPFDAQIEEVRAILEERRSAMDKLVAKL